MPEMSAQTGVLYGSANRFLMGYFWIGFFIAVLLISFGYAFEDNHYFFVRMIKFFVYAVLFVLFAAPFTSLTILLFSRKPVVEIGHGTVRFPIIDLTLTRDDVQNVVPQKSKVSDYWRARIELRSEMLGHYRTWFLWPAAFSWGRKVFIVTMCFGKSEAELQRRIVEVLSPRETAGELE